MQDNRFMNTAAATSSQIDVGLRAYMLGVYNHMTTALLLTGFFAYATKMLATKETNTPIPTPVIKVIKTN